MHRKKRPNQRVDIAEVKSLFRSNKEYTVRLNPHNIAMTVALLITLLVLIVLTILQVYGFSISLRTVLIYPALVFVLGYGVTGILGYYGILALKRKQVSEERLENQTQDTSQQS